MTVLHWLRPLWRWLCGHRACRERRAMMEGKHEDRQHQDAMSLPPLPGEEAMDPEQQAALERVRRAYHEGTQPLTVAKARYDLLKRQGLLDGT